jgi:hypothetical protein
MALFITDHITILKSVEEHEIFFTIIFIPAAVGNVHSDKQVPVPVQILLRGGDESRVKTIHPQL